jgi:hypothetical protein
MDETDDPSLDVIAVWMPAFPGDAREKWSPNLLTDSRADHYWDEGFVVGRFFKEQADFSRFPGPHVWDAYVLFGPEAKWETVPTPMVGWGNTILGERNSLTEQLWTMVTPKG